MIAMNDCFIFSHYVSHHFHTTPSITMFMFVTVSISILTILTWLYRRYTFWSSQGMPGPRPVPLLGNMWDYRKKTMKDVDIMRNQMYGDVYGTYNGTNLVLNVCSPELIKKTLIADFRTFSGRNPPNDHLMRQNLVGQNGKEWKEQRTIISQSFTSGKMKRMLPLMYECCESFCQAIDAIISNRQNQSIDLKKLFNIYTLNVTAKCQFGIEFSGFLDEDHPFMKNAIRFMSIPFKNVLIYMFFPRFLKDWIGFLPNPKDAFDYMVSVAKEILKQRRQSNNSRQYPDVLQLLAEASSEDIEETVQEIGEHHGHEEHHWSSSTAKKKLTDDEVISNILVFLSAGFDTSSITLSYATYALAVNPNVQEKLRTEILEVAKLIPDGKLSYETISGLKYLDAVVSETLRMFPPGVHSQRESVEDYVLEVGSKPYKIPKGTIIHIPIYAFHHNPKYFKDHETFDPERFMPGRKHEITPYSYIPFGAGPRNCVAMRFALLEVKVSLVFLLQKYRFVRTDDTDVPLDFSTSNFMLRAKKVVVGIERFEK